MNYSKQREIIYNILLQDYSHPTAEQVYQKVSNVLPNISKGTVYRNLGQLVEEGLVLRLDLEQNFKRYDAHTHQHGHFVCRECNNVYDIQLKQNNFVKDVETLNNVKILSSKIAFEGICQECQNKSTITK